MEKLFDRSKEYTIKVTDPTSETGHKKCAVRFPTDEEWCERSRAQLIVSRSLGRDASTIELPKRAETSAHLFDKIRVDKDGPEFDEAEKAKVIDRLEQCEVIGVDREGPKYTITMTVLGGAQVTHVLTIPTQKQITDLGRAAVQQIGRRQTSETRVLLEPNGLLWKTLASDFTGYAGQDGKAVPIIHQHTALTELLSAVQTETEGDDPEL